MVSLRKLYILTLIIPTKIKSKIYTLFAKFIISLQFDKTYRKVTKYLKYFVTKINYSMHCRFLKEILRRPHSELHFYNSQA